MRPVSAAFLRTLRGSHRVTFEARVCPPGQTGTDPDGQVLDITGGDLTLDGSANVRSVLDLSVAAPWPSSYLALLAPFGSEIFVRAGVRHSGLTEWVSLGYHRLWRIERSLTNRGELRLDASDRASRLLRERLPAPVQFEPSATYGQVMARLVTDVIPGAVIEWDDLAYAQTLGRSLIIERDRWEGLDKLIKALGKLWYWDHRGVLVIKSPPSITESVWEIDQGRNGVLVDMTEALDTTEVINGFVVTGEAADTEESIRALVTDDNPTSPTRWGGAFGKVPRFYSSPLIRSYGQAMDAGTTMLARHIGAPASVNLGAVPNYALEPWDPVTVQAERSGSASTHVLDRITMPFEAGAPMTADTRERATLIVGEGDEGE